MERRIRLMEKLKSFSSFQTSSSASSTSPIFQSLEILKPFPPRLNPERAEIIFSRVT